MPKAAIEKFRNDLFSEVIERANRYLTDLPNRPVSPAPGAVAGLERLNLPLQDQPMDPVAVLAELDDIGSSATVASAGHRYFGFVTGGALPATLAANMLAAAWDQNAVLETASPVAAFIEEVCRKWLVSLLRLPPPTAVGFATGATMANFTGLAAARHALLEQQGWDVESRGLFGAPAIEVITGEEVHVSVLKALSMLGLGRDRVVKVPTDEQGRMRADSLPAIDGPTIICIQAGNVNTGAFDPAAEICINAREKGPGSMSMAPSACGPPPRPPNRRWPKALKTPIPGPQMPTNGSTCPMTAVWYLCAMCAICWRPCQAMRPT